MDNTNTSISSSLSPVVNSDDASKIFGVSLRGIIAIIIVSTICLMSGFKEDIKEPLYTLGTVVIAFYFGHSIGASTKKSL